MLIFFKTLFNIIIDQKEKVYTLDWILFTIVKPAKLNQWSVVNGRYLSSRSGRLTGLY